MTMTCYNNIKIYLQMLCVNILLSKNNSPDFV